MSIPVAAYRLETIIEEEEESPTFTDSSFSSKSTGKAGPFSYDQYAIENPDDRGSWRWDCGEDAERFEDILHARDNFLVGIIEFFTQRGMIIHDHHQHETGEEAKPSIWEPTHLPFSIYLRLFNRVRLINNRHEMASRVRDSKVINLVAQTLGLDPIPHQRHPAFILPRGYPRTWRRDRGEELCTERGSSAFTEMVESFVRLSTSCKEAKHHRCGTLF